MSSVVAIIPAAGSGKRMKQSVNKQFLEINGQTIIERTLRAFEESKKVHAVIVVTKSTEIDTVNQLISSKNFKKVRSVVEGGAERQDSIYNGLKMTSDQDRWVLVHDGARPFITSEMIDDMVDDLVNRNNELIDEEESVIMAVPSKDTIKRVEGDRVAQTLNRAELWNVQTPQGFSRKLLMKAYEKAKREGFTGTDDASLVEWMGYKVHVHMGSYENIKVTTPDDIYLGEAILKKRGVV